MEEEPGRQFLCGGCRATVRICRRCDRGQIYCGRGCAQRARCLAQRQAGARYQRSRRGRFAHAERTRCYRARQKIVTHHGSPAAPAGALLSAMPLVIAVPVPVPAPVPATPAVHACHFCGARCGPAVRLDFLRSRRRGRPPRTRKR